MIVKSVLCIFICIDSRYNHYLFNDSREALVEIALQLLVVVLDYDMEQQHFIDQAQDQAFEVQNFCDTMSFLLYRSKYSALINFSSFCCICRLISIVVGYHN